MRRKRGVGSFFFYLLLATMVGMIWLARAIFEVIQSISFAVLNLFRYAIEIMPTLLSNPWFWILSVGGLAALCIVVIAIRRRSQVDADFIEVELEGNTVTYWLVENRQVPQTSGLDADQRSANESSGSVAQTRSTISANDAVSAINDRLQGSAGILRRGSIDIFYRLDVPNAREFSLINQAFEQLTSADRVWSITSQTPQWDYKRNAGATSTIQRTKAAIGITVPTFVAFDLAAYSIRDGSRCAIFLPDQILGFEGRRCSSIRYQDLQVSVAPFQYIEDEYLPCDANRIGTTWRYVNKNGTPDLRFKYNKQIPVLRYAIIEFTLSAFLRVTLMVSNVPAAENFSRLISEFRAKGSRADSRSRARENDNQRSDSPRYTSASSKTPYEILGIASGVSIEEISRAYRNLAKQYHPDVVAGLAPEFRELAESRMKEINAAYEAIRSKK